jgi:hypothetical protein
MARTITVPAQEVTESITSIQHYPNEIIRFLVGVGKVVNGTFEFDVPQQFSQFEIKDQYYTDFVTAYGLNFAHDDLWNHVDQIRTGQDKTRPSANYDWDGTAWVPNLDRAKATVKAAILAEQIRLDNLPIVFEGVTVDGDATAKSNILGKLTEISSAEDLGQAVSPLIWRDADNEVHTFDTIAAYKAWLQGVMVALCNRSTLLYMAAWKNGDAVALLTRVDVIESIDITQGWPT